MSAFLPGRFRRRRRRRCRRRHRLVIFDRSTPNAERWMADRGLVWCVALRMLVLAGGTYDGFAFWWVHPYAGINKMYIYTYVQSNECLHASVYEFMHFCKYFSASIKSAFTCVGDSRKLRKKVIVHLEVNITLSCVCAYAFKLLRQINSVVPLWERYLYSYVHTDTYILNFHAFRISFFI